MATWTVTEEGEAEHSVTRNGRTVGVGDQPSLAAAVRRIRRHRRWQPGDEISVVEADGTRRRLRDKELASIQRAV